MTSQHNSYQIHFQREEELTTSEERKKAMCIVHMRVQCSDRFSELLLRNVEQTTNFVESIVGTALLELFDTVLVENVTISLSPEEAAQGMEGNSLDFAEDCQTL